MSPAFIQKRLRWMGDSFKMYLRDTLAIQNKHVSALHSASADVLALLATPPEEVARLTATMSEASISANDGESADMGLYIDEMD